MIGHETWRFSCTVATVTLVLGEEGLAVASEPLGRLRAVCGWLSAIALPRPVASEPLRRFSKQSKGKTSKSRTKTFQRCGSCVPSLAFGACVRRSGHFATLPGSEIQRTQRLEAALQHRKRARGARSETVADGSAPDQTALAQLRASSGAAQSEISGLQALAADHVHRREVGAMREEAKADAAALGSEVGEP
jgi:hypothetical protein